jgi:hypothetical protein
VTRVCGGRNEQNCRSARTHAALCCTQPLRAVGCTRAARPTVERTACPCRSRPTPATSAPGLGSPRPRLHRDWAHPGHACTGTGLTPATSAPGLGSPRPRLHRDWAHPSSERATGRLTDPPSTTYPHGACRASSKHLQRQGDFTKVLAQPARLAALLWEYRSRWRPTQTELSAMRRDMAVLRWRACAIDVATHSAPAAVIGARAAR